MQGGVRVMLFLVSGILLTINESATHTLVLWQSSIAAFDHLIINLDRIQSGQVLLSDTGQIGI